MMTPAVTRSTVHESVVLTLFRFTLCIAAMLLFQVQPMAAKILLPLLGGAPATWNGCIVFFQGSLPAISTRI